jgi:hypothetical protein
MFRGFVLFRGFVHVLFRGFVHVLFRNFIHLLFRGFVHVLYYIRRLPASYSVWMGVN